MIFSNIALVGFYLSFIIVFLYCYWGYAYYRVSSTRVGMIAASKYYKEMTEADPTKLGYEPKPTSVVISGSSATVAFDIYNNDKPAVRVGTAARKYNLVDSHDECLGTTSKPIRKSTPECQGLLSEDMNKICFYQTTGGLGCIWL